MLKPGNFHLDPVTDWRVQTSLGTSKHSVLEAAIFTQTLHVQRLLTGAHKYSMQLLTFSHIPFFSSNTRRPQLSGD